MSTSTAALLSKQGLVVAELARALLACAPGERIERVQHYAARFDASVGTVQAAFDYLQSSGAAQLVARGRLGTSVRALNYPLLWALAGGRPVVGALPLPYSRRFEGLATGIRAQWSSQPLPLDLRFMRGSAQRLEALATGRCDWALMSRFAAEQANAVQSVLLLGTQSYMDAQVLLLRATGARELHDRMRLGVDYQSSDHVHAVRTASSGKQVELVPIAYNQGLQLVSTGAIDATIWSRQDIPADLPSVVLAPLDPPTDAALAPLREAALVVEGTNHTMAHLLGAILDRDELLRVQGEVVALARVPMY